ncbi:hypothetical protein EYR41_004282 [Orbilia oligospora]|uniref:Uncharacterized protein n=1 Tax=Orbilia oligospora TaxID=2813651 RepID=A0A8H2E7J6_ORBOL|nr:hypothetical protein EYR41_004282 [Orbilia oligospora]
MRNLHKYDVKIINGPCANSRSPVLASQILTMKKAALLNTSHNSHRLVTMTANARLQWRGVQKSKFDLAMICEGYINNYGFLTADHKVANFFDG